MPLKIPVGRLGEWKHPRYGVLKMSQDTFEQMKQNFVGKAIGRDPFIRIGHDKGDTPTFGGAPALGWIKELVQEGDVLYALADPINDAVEQMIKSGQYRYSSPEYEENYKDKENGSSRGAALLALSLTNEPFLTRLPEVRALSDLPDQFYLYEEVQSMEKMDELLNEQKQTNGLLRKLADFFSGKKPEDNPNPVPNPTPQPPAATPDEATKRQLADMQAQIEAANLATHAANVNRKLSDYINAGIPPAVVEQYRPILLADVKQEKTIKLADDKGERMISLSEQVYGILDAFPKEARVPLNSQMGAQGKPPEGAEMIQLCDQDMQELGYSVENGRYKL